MKKGSKHTEETRRKMSNSHKGKKLSKETRRKIGLTSKRRKHSKEARRKMSIAHRRENLSVKTLQKMSIVQRGNKSALGHRCSVDAKRKMSMAQSGCNHRMWGKTHSQETKDTMSKATKITRKLQVLPIKDTKIEVKIQNFLT